MVLNYNGAGLLRQYLPELIRCLPDYASIWVADNCSTDDSKELIRSTFPTVKWLQNGTNAGYAKGYNLSLSKIDAAYYLLINSDVRVSVGFLQPLLTFMQNNPKAGAIQPKILWDRHPEQFEYAGAAGGFIDCLGYPFCRGRLLNHLENDEGQYDNSTPVFWTSGACMLVRAEAFHLVGGFYDYFFMHQEEIDFCWRLQLAGYSCHAVPSSVVYHLGGATLSTGNSRKTYYNFRNNLVMLARNMPAGRMLWLVVVRFILDFLAALHYLFSGKASHAMAVIKGWLGFLRWIFTYGKASKYRKSPSKLQGYFGGSLLWNYYLLGKKTWAKLMES